MPPSTRARLTPRARALLAAGSMALASAAAAAGPRVTLAVMPSLDNTHSSGRGLNDAGQVVGWSDFGLAQRPVLWQVGTSLRDLGTLGGNDGQALGINGWGLVVGNSSTGNGPTAAVRWPAGQSAQVLNPAVSGFSTAHAVNDNGQAVGDGPPSRATLWQAGGSALDLGVLPGHTGSSANAINASGSVAGSSSGAASTRAFLWQPASGMQDLGLLGGGTISFATAINDGGSVVGSAFNAAFQSRAFLWQAGVGMRDLGTLGGNSRGQGINAAGQVVGTSDLVSGSQRAFLWHAATGMNDLALLTGPGFTPTAALAVNRHAQVAGDGSGSASGGYSRGYLLTLHPDWSGGDGQWDDTTGSRWNWAGTGTAAAQVGGMHDVLINPGRSATVWGGADAQARTLQIGGTAGRIVTLDLNQGSTATSGGTLVAPGGALRGAGRLDGDVRVDGGRVQVGAGQLMQLGGSLSNHGNIDLQAHGGVARLQVAGKLGNADDGQLNLLHADLLAQGGLANAGRINIAGLSTVGGAVDNAVGARIAVSGNAADAIFWDAVHNDGDVSVTTSSVASFFGRVTGAGSFSGGGGKNLAGGFAPGNSPALVSLQGAVVFDAGDLVMDLGGTAPGSGHDKLVFSDGSVTINGAAVDLQLQWWGGYTGQAGDGFDLFDWNAGFSPVAGSFGAIAMPALASGLAWDISRLYVDGSVLITAVPEPGTWALMLGGLVSLGSLARRRAGAPRRRTPLGRGWLAAVGLAWAVGAQAAPLAPSVDRELMFLTADYICGTGLDNQVLRPCEATNGASLHTASHITPLGSAASGQLAARVDGFDGLLVTVSPANTTGIAILTAIQFDDLTVTGPTPTVPVGVKLTVQGTTAASNARLVRGTLGFVAGRRAPSPNPSWSALTDRIDGVTRIQILDTSATLGLGVTKPNYLQQTNGSFLAQIGTPFEYGFEFTLYSMNVAMNFSAQVEYSLPAGYTLSSARGLAVNVTPVPEPGTWALMLAGLAAVAGLARRRAAAR